jgi:NAD(P)H-dependent FMN reductase
MSKPRLLAFAGSARSGSLNRKLLAVAAEAAGAGVTLLDLRDYPLPLYDGDLEAAEGLPPNALRLKQLFLEHQGLLIAAPEYNSSITPLLKNTIDWVSRSAPGEAPLAAYKGKVAALLSASPGSLGGLRGLQVLRLCLSSIGVLVLPDQVAVPSAHEAFAEDGSLKDAKRQAAVTALARKLAEVVAKLGPQPA